MDDIDRRVLAIEGRWYRHGGAKVTAIRDELDLTETDYFRRLNALLNDPAAALEFPMTVARLRRLRSDRMGRRSARRLPNAANVIRAY